MLYLESVKRGCVSLIRTGAFTAVLLFWVLLIWSCATYGRSSPSPSSTSPPQETPAPPPAAEISAPPEPFLNLTFAGDIMAHRCNYQMPDYSMIYEDLEAFLSADDLTFGNLEMPVDDSLPLSTYPRFNVHSSYVEKAVEGGFDVFSLANNHSNDQGLGGIKATLEALSSLEGVSAWSGLSRDGVDSASPSAFVPMVLERKGYGVVFLAVTELLNSYDASRRLVYYLAPREAARAEFLERIAALRSEYPHSLFILSLHLSEVEYGRAVDSEKKKWFSRLAEAGIDIVWAHHPHVMQEWEVTELDGRQRLFMYSMGNFISGQRWDLDRENPAGYREYTGDAVLLRLETRRAAEGFRFDVKPQLVTNWKDPRHGMVVRRFTEAFIESLPEFERPYFRARRTLMEAYLPLLPLSE